MHGRTSHPPAAPVPGVDHAPSPGERTTSPGATGPTPSTMPHGSLGAAIVLLAASEAVIARTRPDGRDEIARVQRRSHRADAPPFHVRILHELGDRAPVVIMGPAADRTAFEREFVAVSHRPDRLMEDASIHDAHPEALLERLRGLRSHPG
jgi:hypothetical protein